MVGETGRFILVSCKPNNVHHNGVINYLVYCLHGLLGADTPHQCPDGMRGNKMAVALVVSRHRKIRPFREIRNPWAFHSRAFDLRAQLCHLAFNPRAKNLPWAGYWHLVLMRIMLIPLFCLNNGALDNSMKEETYCRSLVARPGSCPRRRQP